MKIKKIPVKRRGNIVKAGFEIVLGTGIFYLACNSEYLREDTIQLIPLMGFGSAVAIAGARELGGNLNYHFRKYVNGCEDRDSRR